MEKVLACGCRPGILLERLLPPGEREARDERLEGVLAEADAEAQEGVAKVQDDSKDRPQAVLGVKMRVEVTNLT